MENIPKVNNGEEVSKAVRQDTDKAKLDNLVADDSNKITGEGKSSIKNIIGRPSESFIKDILDAFPDSSAVEKGYKDMLLEETTERFNSRHQRSRLFGEIGKVEKIKEETDEVIILVADNLTNDILTQYGFETFEIPTRNVHIIKTEEWPDSEADAAAFYDVEKQNICVREGGLNVEKLHSVIHEMIHFKSYNSLQLLIKKNMKGNISRTNDVKVNRVGFSVHSRSGESKYFSVINEAITEELSKKLIKSGKLANHPVFAEEINTTKEIMGRYPVGNIATNIDDIYLAKVFNSSNELVSNKVTVGRKEFSYEDERKFLNTLIEEIFDGNREKFKDKQEIFDIFVKTVFGGRLTQIGKLIDETFGRGSFRKIGEVEDTPEDLKELSEFLKKQSAKKREAKVEQKKREEENAREIIRVKEELRAMMKK